MNELKKEQVDFLKFCSINFPLNETVKYKIKKIIRRMHYPNREVHFLNDIRKMYGLKWRQHKKERKMKYV